MMSKFNFDDFQQSWKTDRHSELKREFIERYRDTFKDEKLLLYLAEVYANVILMKCSYPEPLMKEITELSKPLQMHKQVKEINGKTRVKRLINEQEDTEKTSSMLDHLKRPSKQLKIFANEGQSSSTFPSTSINRLHSAKEQTSDMLSVSLSSKEGAQILLNLKQVLKASKDLSEQASERTSERQFNSTVSIASTNVPSVEQFKITYPVPLYNEQNSQILSTSEPVYKTPEHSRPFKQVKFYANEEQSSSTFFSADTDVLQPSAEQFRNTYSIPFLEEQNVQNLSKSEQPLKSSVEYSERLVRQINFPANERQSNATFSSTLTDELQPPMDHFRNTLSIPFLEEHVSQSLSKSEEILEKSIDQSKTSFKQVNFNANEEQSSSTILSTSTDVLQPSLEKFRIAYPIPFLEELAQSLSKSKQGLKKSVEHTEIPFKQMNLCVDEGQSNSKCSSPSTNVLQSFQKQFCNTYAAPFYNEQDAEISSKSEQILKTSERLSERSFKQINCVDEGQSSSTISINMLQHSIKEFTNTCSTPVQHSVHYPKDNEHKVQILPKLEQTFETSSLDEKKEPLYQIKDIFIEKKKADSIISALGLSFIQRFAELAKSCVYRFSVPMEILQHICLKLRVWYNCSFEVDTDPDSPQQAALNYHKFYLKGCLIACETSMHKKKGKTLVVEAALKTLVKLATLDRKKASQIYRSTSKRKNPKMNSMEFFDIFSKNVINRTKEEPAIVTLKSIASLLDVEEDCVVFKVASSIVADYATEYTSKLFINGILVSYGKDNSIQSSKNLAAEFALIKLSNLPEYVIHRGELKKRLDYRKDVHSASSSSSKASSTSIKGKHSFILNKNLFDSSIRDEVMLIQRDRVPINIQRNLRDFINDSANFSHKQLFFELEDITTNTPAYIKAKIRIGMLELAAGVAFSGEEAKTIACAKAFLNMQRKYYTLRVKDQHIEGFLVTLDQVINEESYSKNKIKNQYLRLEKIKKKKAVFKVEFPGKDIRDSIEVTSNQPLSKDKKLSHTEAKSSNTGTKPETKTTVTDTKPSSTDISPSCINTSLESTAIRHDFSLFVEKLEIMLQKFLESEDYCDLLFSEEFTLIHRNLIVKAVKKLYLRYVFLIDEPKTYVCVKHRYEVTELLNFLVKNGGSNCKFELIDASKTTI